MNDEEEQRKEDGGKSKKEYGGVKTDNEVRREKRMGGVSGGRRELGGEMDKKRGKYEEINGGKPIRKRNEEGR